MRIITVTQYPHWTRYSDSCCHSASYFHIASFCFLLTAWHIIVFNPYSHLARMFIDPCLTDVKTEGQRGGTCPQYHSRYNMATLWFEPPTWFRTSCFRHFKPRKPQPCYANISYCVWNLKPTWCIQELLVALMEVLGVLCHRGNGPQWIGELCARRSF